MAERVVPPLGEHAGAAGGDFVAVAQGTGPVELTWSGLVGAPGAGGAGEVAEGVGVEVDGELQLF